MARRGMIVHDGIGPVLNYMVGAVAGNVYEAMSQGRDDLESYAKQNAPWADQTGAARGGLTADVHEEGGEIVIDLFHTVDHGYWLELIQDGRFAIILPTIEALGPQIIRDAGGRVTDTSRVI